LELFEPARRSDPYPGYERLRSTHPIWQPLEGLFVITRHQDCLAVLRDARFGHSEGGELGFFSPGDAEGAATRYEPRLRSFLGLNPPDHTRLRRLVSRSFTPRRVEELGPFIEALTADLVAAAKAGPAPVDLVQAVASPLPVTVISELLGVPADDRERLVGWSHDLGRGLEPGFLVPDDERGRQVRARAELESYWRQLAAERRRKPGEDLLSALVSAHDQGDALNEDELVATCHLLLIAGHETTTSLIGNGALALLRHPGQLARLRQEPGLVARAVEEMLRYDAPVQLTFRAALTDADIGGVEVPKGSFVLVLVGAANRDPGAHPEPDVLDIERPPAPNLAFGQGVHFCIGAPLARLEAQLAFRSLMREAGDLHLAGEPVWKDNTVLRGLSHLPVTLQLAS
jgi:cytochrome P450